MSNVLSQMLDADRDNGTSILYGQRDVTLHKEQVSPTTEVNRSNLKSRELTRTLVIDERSTETEAHSIQKRQ